MNKSDSIKDLAGALAKAQAEITGAAKDGNNPHFRSSYATLSSVWDAVREPLTKNGLSVCQLVTSSESDVKVETILLHSSGEWLSETLAIPASKADAQGFGSALTYARRYGLSAIAGVAPADDDGNAATASAPPRAAKPPTKPSAEQETITMDWVAALDECANLDELKAKFRLGWEKVHAFGFPMLDNMLTGAKDTRKAALEKPMA